MTVFEFSRKLEKLNETEIRRVGVESVLQNQDIIIQDAITANIEGMTFAGNDIKKFAPFTDWEETGEFHENLKFESANDISFT